MKKKNNMLFIAVYKCTKYNWNNGPFILWCENVVRGTGVYYCTDSQKVR